MYWNNSLTDWPRVVVVMLALILPAPLPAQGPTENSSDSRSNPGAAPATVTQAASDLGISFVEGSNSQVLIQRDGRQYIVDVANHTIREAETPKPAVSGALFESKTSSGEAGWSSSAETATSGQTGVANRGQSSDPPTTAEKRKGPGVYDPDDDLIFSVPTGRRLDRHGFYINFTHRFSYEASFKGTGRGDTLLGLDDFSISSFGVRYGVTSKLSVMAYRSPSIIGRPIELMAAYNFLDERDKMPFNAAVRLSVDGQNNFATNFTENIELTVSRSIGHRAQLYADPTFSIRNRPVMQNQGALLQDPMPVQHCNLARAVGIDPSLNVHPCANTFSLGVAAAVDVRPTVAIVAEAIPTLANATDLGIHRSPFSFGVKKKIWRHAFTLGFTNSPGTLVSNRAGTNATFLQKASADRPSQMFIGFDLTRQVY